MHNGILQVKSYNGSILNMNEDSVGEQVAVSHWDSVGRWFLYLLAFVVPILALPFTASPIATNKVAISYFFIIAAFLCWLVGRINSGVVVLPKNYLALALVLLVVVWAASGIFSLSPHVSFYELNDGPSGFFAILMFTLAAFVAYFYLRSPEQIFFWILSFLASAFLVFVAHFFRIFFNLNIFWWADFPSAVSNVFGSWTEFGIFFGLIAVISVYLFEVLSEKRLRIILFALLLFSLVAIAAVNNSITLWMTFSFLLIILAYLFALKPRGVNIFRLIFWVILAVLLLVQSPAVSSSIVSYLGTDSIEVRPSWPASWTVIQKTLEENPLLGSGPATFVYDWLRFKPLAVNESIFWATRFSGGTAFAASLLAETGIFGFMSFVFLVAAFLFYAVKTLLRSGETRPDPIFVLIILANLMLLVYSFIYSLGFTLTLFAFVFLGMFMALVSEYGMAKEYRIALFQNSGSGFISALAIIFLLIVSVSGFYVFGQKYASAYFYGRALRSSSSGDLSGSRAYLDKAAAFGPRDVYFRVASELDLTEMSSLLSRSDVSADDVRSGFQNTLSRAIQNVQSAVNLNPVEPLNWISLGRVYEAVIPFQIQGAANFASAAYIEAGAKNPTSPEPLLARARVALALNQLSDAKTLLEESLKLKNSYTPAHFLLAQIEDAQGNTSNAIARAEAAVILSPNDMGTLFQLGLLYYRADRFNNAGVVFERAVSLNKNYSNARYFLGLIYDRLGSKDAAIEQFEQVSALNPQNQEVEKILNNLRLGKNALSGIAPPPEERKEPPVKE